VKRKKQPIVGPGVASQTKLRPSASVRDLDEFIEFLRRIRAVFGTDDRPRRPTTGDRFRL
jgi:hypothetical protein